jgi:hypothetical protein
MLSVTKDLGMVLGIYTAEGSASSRIGSRSNEITQSEDLNPEVCTALRQAWSRTFGWNLKEFRSSSKRTFYLPTLYSEFFKKLCGETSENKKVPDFIYSAPLGVVSSYLRGLFSGDGYSNARKVSISSKSRMLIEQVSYLLTYFDIDSRIRVCYNSRYKVHYYQLSVIGTSSRIKFHEHIGFIQSRFQLIPASGPRNKELLPISAEGLIYVKARILKRLGIARFRHIKLHDATGFNLMLLPRYNELISALSKYADSFELALLSSIRTMLNNQDVTLDEIVTIEKEARTCRMYDFAIPEYERFVAGNLPSLLHNSQTPEFLKKTFYDSLDILGKVYGPQDFERARVNIKELLTSAVSRIRRKEVPIQDLSFNVMMGKALSGFSETIPQHVRAAQLLHDRGREIKAGDIISYVKTKNPPYVKPTILARPEDIDVDKYLEYARSMFDQILDGLGFNFDEIMGGTTLDLFWS